MMRPLNAREFAEQLRLEGCEFADEILELCDLNDDDDADDLYFKLVDDLDYYAPALRGDPQEQLEWLGDRSNLLVDIENQLKQAGLTGNADNMIRQLLAELADEDSKPELDL